MNDNLKQREQELEAEALRINAGRKPKFGDLMRNPWASESNPIRDGYFVRKCGAGVDAYYEFTNGNGKFWKTRARFAFFIEAARATPAQPVPVQSIELIAKRMAEYSGWGHWDTATDCRHTPSGNEPEDERQYWLELARIAHQSPASEVSAPSSIGDAIRALPLPETENTTKVGAFEVRAWTKTHLGDLLFEAAALAEQVQGPQVPEGFNYSTENRAWPDFGDYVLLEQKRFGVPNEMFVHKVVQRLRSNYWIDVPAVTHNGPSWHDHMEDVVHVICCGVSEDKVLRYRVADCKPYAAAPSIAQDGQKSEGV